MPVGLWTIIWSTSLHRIAVASSPRPPAELQMRMQARRLRAVSFSSHDPRSILVRAGKRTYRPFATCRLDQPGLQFSLTTLGKAPFVSIRGRSPPRIVPAPAGACAPSSAPSRPRAPSDAYAPSGAGAPPWSGAPGWPGAPAGSGTPAGCSPAWPGAPGVGAAPSRTPDAPRTHSDEPSSRTHMPHAASRAAGDARLLDIRGLPDELLRIRDPIHHCGGRRGAESNTAKRSEGNNSNS